MGGQLPRPFAARSHRSARDTVKTAADAEPRIFQRAEPQARKGRFQGRTLATMSASGKKAFELLFEPKVPGFPKAQLNDLDSVKQLITDKTIGVMLEPIQGEAGVWPATDQFLGELRTLTREHGLLLIVTRSRPAWAAPE